MGGDEVLTASEYRVRMGLSIPPRAEPKKRAQLTLDNIVQRSEATRRLIRRLERPCGPLGFFFGVKTSV